MPVDVPIACRLDAGERSARLARARELGKRALVGLEVRNGLALLRFRGEREAVDALVAAERDCCAFFEITTSRHGDDTEVKIRTPEGGEPLLRGLVAGIVAGWQGALT